MCLCVCLDQTGTQPSLQRSHVYLHKHHLQRERLILLLDKEGQNHRRLLYFCGTAPNHVQASTVVRHFIVCICKYVEIIRGHIFVRDFFSKWYIKKNHPGLIHVFVFCDDHRTVALFRLPAAFHFSLTFWQRDLTFSLTHDSYVDDGLVIHIWQPSGNCKSADNVMQRSGFPDSGDEFLSL